MKRDGGSRMNGVKKKEECISKNGPFRRDFERQERAGVTWLFWFLPSLVPNDDIP